MNRFNKLYVLLLLVLGVFVTSCVDNNFDEPENTFNISGEKVVTVQEVLDLLGSGPVVLGASNIGEEARYIKATVTADDASGNFYKNIFFQDGTNALNVMLDRNELNAEFPAGNTIYIKLNGLTLALNNELPTLGYAWEDDRLQRIPDALVNDFCIPGGKGDVIEPTTMTISDFAQNSNKYVNKLVVLEKVEFTQNWVGKQFADPDNADGPQTLNTTIADCDGESVILRNSGYADFAGELIPNGSGTLTAIASKYRDDLQLFIRDLTDINFTQDRCDGSGGQADNEVAISNIKDLYYGQGADKAPEGYIKGIVISDRTNPTFQPKNVVVQNGDHGIIVRFTDAHTLNVGDEVQITVSGYEVSEFKSALQVTNVPVFNAVSLGAKGLPTPKQVTVDEIKENINLYESTLVKIINAEMSGSTFGDDVTVDDGTETIDLFTWSTASFANDALPSGKVEITAVVGQYNDPQLVINKRADVVGGTDNPDGGMEEEITIASVKAAYYNDNASKASKGFITGTVISDKSNPSFNNKNVVVQNGTDGIVVRFTDAHDFRVGQTVKIIVTGIDLSEYKDVLQLNNTPISNVSVTGSGDLPNPTLVTIGEILNNLNKYESTRVMVQDVTLSGSTYGAGVEVSDASGAIEMYTRSNASFANENVPSGKVSVTAIIGHFNNPQMVINDLNDIQ